MKLKIKLKWVYYLIAANLAAVVVLLTVMAQVQMPPPEPEEPEAPEPEPVAQLDDSLPQPPGSEAWCEAIMEQRYRQWSDEEAKTFSDNCLYDLSD